MTDYISREAAIEALRKAHSPYPRRREISVRAIQDIPPAAVRPVVRGKWIVSHDFDSYQLLQCDQCNSMMWNHEKETPNFCHNCGADMREVKVDG